MTKLSCKVLIYEHRKVRNHWEEVYISDIHPKITKRLNDLYQSGGKLPKIGEEIVPHKRIIRKHSDNNNIYLVVE